MGLSREEMNKRVESKGYSPKKERAKREPVKVWEDKIITPSDHKEAGASKESLERSAPHRSEDRLKDENINRSQPVPKDDTETSGAVQKLLDRELVVLGGVQKKLLNALYRKSKEMGGNEAVFVRQSDLSRLASVAQGSVKNSIGRLIKKGLIEKEDSILSHGGGYVLKVNSYVYDKLGGRGSKNA